MPDSFFIISDILSLDYRAALPDDAAVSDLQAELESRLRRAVVSALGDDYADTDPLIVPAKDTKFGDYQANLAMGLAKRVGEKPRENRGRKSPPPCPSAS